MAGDTLTHRTPFYALCLVMAWLIGVTTPVLAIKWVWDGEVTTGKSGVERNVDDDRDSTSKAFHEEKNTITWPLPIDRYFEDVDPEEDGDNPQDNRHVSTYAMAVMPRQWHYIQTVLPTGMYLVKLGTFTAGSLNTHLVWQPLPPSSPNYLKTLAGRLNAKNPIPDQLTLVFTQQGRVKAVLPVTGIDRLTKAQKKVWDRDYAQINYPSIDNSGVIQIRGKRFSYAARLE